MCQTPIFARVNRSSGSSPLLTCDPLRAGNIGILNTSTCVLLTADFVGCAQGHFLLWLEDVRKREFSGKVHPATNVASTRLQILLHIQ